MLKRILKNERGLTLIELLAVIVIIGIVSAIAVPSVGNIIENSRRDAHVANARMLIDATRMAITADGLKKANNNGNIIYTIGDLETGGFLRDIKVPGENFNYESGASFVEVKNGGSVTVPNFQYIVTLDAATRTSPYIDGEDEESLDRGVVDMDDDGNADGVD